MIVTSIKKHEQTEQDDLILFSDVFTVMDKFLSSFLEKKLFHDFIIRYSHIYTTKQILNIFIDDLEKEFSSIAMLTNITNIHFELITTPNKQTSELAQISIQHRILDDDNFLAKYFFVKNVAPNFNSNVSFYLIVWFDYVIN